MTTNKPEVVAWSWDYRGRHMATTDYSQALELAEPPYPTKVDPLIRLSDYEKLAAECEKLRKDAERYRWLRKQCGNSGLLTIAKVGAFELKAWSGDDPDAAIDAAMEGDKP